jgi:hypothetical protein
LEANLLERSGTSPRYHVLEKNTASNENRLVAIISPLKIS